MRFKIGAFFLSLSWLADDDDVVGVDDDDDDDWNSFLKD